jgi:Ca2+-transporting ATPase
MLTRGFVWHFTWLGVVIGLLVMGGYLGVLYANGWSWGAEIVPLLHLKASSFAFAMLVTIQLFNAFNFCSDKFSVFSLKVKMNPYLWGATLISFVLVLAIVELPVLQSLLGTTGLSLSAWMAIFGLSASVIVVEELRKLVGVRFSQSPR